MAPAVHLASTETSSFASPPKTGWITPPASRSISAASEHSKMRRIRVAAPLAGAPATGAAIAACDASYAAARAAAADASRGAS